MNNTFLYAILLALVFFEMGCAGAPKENIQLLNGYWEIAEIENAYGSKKEFILSQNIDFFELTQEGKGVRKKVQPDIQGNFTTTNASENIDIVIKGNTVFIKYSTAFDSWKEELIFLSNEKLVLQNEENYTYTYKRYEPLSIE